MKESKNKKIVFISHSDTLGGAAIFTLRLMRELRRMGHSVKMLVMHRYGDDPDVVKVGNSLSRGYNFLGERLQIILQNGFSRKKLFQVSTGFFGLNLLNNRYIREADVIMIGWINQGLISLNTIRRLASGKQRVIWTMHDMWCMTGICHHAAECTHYMNGCGDCPFLGRKASSTDLSRRTWLRKKKVYENSDIRFVAVSSWQRQKALQSSLMAKSDLTRIPNAFPVEDFPPHAILPGSFPGTKDFKNIISFGAARIDDPIKGVEYAIEALNILVEREPWIAANSVAVFFGYVRDPNTFNNLRFPHLHVGRITNPLSLQQLYATSKVILSTSLYETLGGTLIEGMSCGAVPVSFGMGGQIDIIDHLQTGYIAEYLDSNDIANGILWAYKANLSRETLHKKIKERFSASAIAKRYLALSDR